MATLIPFELPLSGAHVRMLTDGVFFLNHLDVLATEARIQPLCRTCGAAAHVRSYTLDENVAEIGCACRAGRVKLDRQLNLASLLLALGWNLHCRDCGDAISGNNDPQASTFTARCDCMTRVYRLPVM